MTNKNFIISIIIIATFSMLFVNLPQPEEKTVVTIPVITKQNITYLSSEGKNISNITLYNITDLHYYNITPEEKAYQEINNLTKKIQEEITKDPIKDFGKKIWPSNPNGGLVIFALFIMYIIIPIISWLKERIVRKTRRLIR